MLADDHDGVHAAEHAVQETISDETGLCLSWRLYVLREAPVTMASLPS